MIPKMPTNIPDAAKAILWLAALGAAVLVASRVVGGVARKAAP